MDQPPLEGWEMGQPLLEGCEMDQSPREITEQINLHWRLSAGTPSIVEGSSL